MTAAPRTSRQAPHPLPVTSPPSADEQRRADTTAAIREVAGALMQLDGRLSAALAALEEETRATAARLAALEARGTPAAGISADLYRRLTSRPLWTAFLVPAGFATAAALAGELSWMQAAAIILGGGSVFGVVEGARDVAGRRARGTRSAER